MLFHTKGIYFRRNAHRQLNGQPTSRRKTRSPAIKREIKASYRTVVLLRAGNVYDPSTTPSTAHNPSFNLASYDARARARVRGHRFIQVDCPARRSAEQPIRRKQNYPQQIKLFFARGNTRSPRSEHLLPESEAKTGRRRAGLIYFL